MRINVDGYALRDPRNLRLARLLRVSRHHVLGQLLDVWAVCYDRVTDTLTTLDIDTAAELDGFASALCDPQIDLAERTRNGLVRIRGAAKRIRYLKEQSDRGLRGGKMSGESRRSKQTLPETEAPGKQTLPETEAVAKPSGSGSGSDPDLDPDPPLPPKGGSRVASHPVKPKPRPKPTDPTPDQSAIAVRVLERITKRTGVAYEGSAAHVRLIAGRLRDGVTERDLRGVVLYAWLELGWEQKPEMHQYLRPETLFGPQTIHKYLPGARGYLARHYPLTTGPPSPVDAPPVDLGIFDRQRPA